MTAPSDGLKVSGRIRTRSHLRLLAAYARLYVLWSFAGRTWTLTLVANRLVPPLIGLAVWRAALPGRTDIATYYVALLLVRLLVDSMEKYTFAPRVYEGVLADDLLQPRPVVLHILGWNLGSRLYNLIVVTPVVVVAGLALHASVDLRLLLLALPAIAVAAALRFLFTYSVSMTAFWTQQAGSAVDTAQLLVFLLGGEAVPLPLLPHSFRGWVRPTRRPWSGAPAGGIRPATCGRRRVGGGTARAGRG